MGDPLLWTAVEQGRRLAKGEVSSSELTEMYLRRIGDLNPRLNAFIHVSPRRARAAARAWDRARAKGKAPSSPLSGVPVGMKDVSFVRGMPTRVGTRSVPPIWAPKDDRATANVRRAGMVILGKLAMAELGAMPVTEPDLHPPTRNPFAPERTAGGSSGGSSCAVAAGMLPIAHGGDGAGSIRIPCALTHLVGLKASRGYVHHDTPTDRPLRLVTKGGLARSVEDLAAFHELFTAWPQRLSERFDVPLRKGLRVAVSTETSIEATEPEYQRAALVVADIFREGGHQISERPWFVAETEEFLVLWKWLIATAPLLMPQRLQPVTRWLRNEGKLITKDHAVSTRARLEVGVLDWFDDVDLWISPTVAMTPPKIGAWRKADPEASFKSILGLGAYTAVFNIGGQPAVSVPMGLADNGIPIGVQIAGRQGQDAQVLQAARLVERAVGGFAVPPPV